MGRKAGNRKYKRRRGANPALLDATDARRLYKRLRHVSFDRSTTGTTSVVFARDGAFGASLRMFFPSIHPILLFFLYGLVLSLFGPCFPFGVSFFVECPRCVFVGVLLTSDPILTGDTLSVLQSL